MGIVKAYTSYSFCKDLHINGGKVLKDDAMHLLLFDLERVA